jgi:hypothetical protein
METITRVVLLEKLSLPPEQDQYAHFTAEQREEMFLPPAKSYYVIDDEANLYLQVDVNGDGHCEQVAEAFQAAWQRIKVVQPDHCQAMSDFWHENAIAGEWKPIIVVDDGVKLIASYNGLGHQFTFHPGGTKLAFADGMLVPMIGHELGHAYHNTLPGSCMNNPQATVKQREDEANIQAMQWDFDMHALTDWANSKRALFNEITNSHVYDEPFTPVP